MSSVVQLIKEKMPIIMGILNLSPASFASEGRCQSVDTALRHVEQLIADGVDIIDLGAEPTNPKQAQSVTEPEHELILLMPVIEAIRQRFDVCLSVDTSQPRVMQETVQAGVQLINDVRALRVPGALEMAAQLDVPVCLMHMRFFEERESIARDIVSEVEQFLRMRLDQVIQAGVRPEHIILDPGLGGGSFGKNTEENLSLLRAIPRLKELGFPVLIGLSRKTFIGELLQNKAEHERVYAGLALNLFAVKQGAAIIRTHDVRALTDSLCALSAIQEIQ